jgi:DivIVA domain-containing protein
MTMTDQLPAIRSSAAFKQAIVGGYDREEVDEYVASLERHIDGLERERTPDGAVQRRLEQVGGEVSGILQQAHETADQLTREARAEADRLLESARREAEELRTTSQREARELTENTRREADERIGASHRDAAQITANAQTRLQELDVDADRIWGERERILADIRFLSQQLLDVAEAAGQRFPGDEADETDETDETDPDPGEVTAPTSEIPELPADIELLPGEAGDPDGATQAFDVGELFESDGDAPASQLPPGSKGDRGEGPPLAGD